MFLLVLISHRLHEHDFCANIFCDLLDFEFPEMGCLDLELSTGYGNNAVLGRLDAFANLLALTHVNLHGLFLPANTNPRHMNCIRPVTISSGIPLGLRGLITFDADSLVS